MWRRAEAQSWTWIPVDTPARRTKRAVGAMVLAGVCLVGGVAIGRMSADTPAPSVATSAANVSEPREAPPETSPQSTAAADMPPPAPIPAKEPQATLQETPAPAAPEPNPSLALKSDAESETVEAKPAPVAPPVKLINPGSSETPKVSSSEQPKPEEVTRKRRWKRELAKQRAAPSRERTARRAPASPNRDYQSLRDYVLAR